MIGPKRSGAAAASVRFLAPTDWNFTSTAKLQSSPRAVATASAGRFRSAHNHAKPKRSLHEVKPARPLLFESNEFSRNPRPAYKREGDTMKRAAPRLILRLGMTIFIAASCSPGFAQTLTEFQLPGMQPTDIDTDPNTGDVYFLDPAQPDGQPAFGWNDSSVAAGALLFDPHRQDCRLECALQPRGLLHEHRHQ